MPRHRKPTCSLCGQRGHRSTTCPSRPSSEGRKCSNCGASGHYAATCLSRPQNPPDDVSVTTASSLDDSADRDQTVDVETVDVPVVVDSQSSTTGNISVAASQSESRGCTPTEDSQLVVIDGAQGNGTPSIIADGGSADEVLSQTLSDISLAVGIEGSNPRSTNDDTLDIPSQQGGSGDVASQSSDGSFVVPGAAARRPRCRRCGQAGHNRRTCKAVMSDEERSNPSQSPILRPRCPRCGQPGCNSDCIPATPDNLSELGDVAEPNRDAGNRVDEVDGHANAPVVPVPVVGVPDNIAVADNPEVDDRVADVCSCCRRISVEGFPLNLRPIGANEAYRKTYGVQRRYVAGDLLCALCVEYLRVGNRFPAWRNGWPATLFTLLTSDDYVQLFNAGELVKSIPSVYRAMWQWCFATFRQDVKDVWNTVPAFIDCTVRLSQFKRKIGRYELASLQNAMNSTPVPQVVCPMGCQFFMDDHASLIPFAHYLAVLCAEFRSFNANPQHFKGARPDYPVVSRLLQWEIGPGTITNNDNGLCIMACPPSEHSDGRHKYLHVPTNPALGAVAPLRSDIIAPVTANPRLVRLARDGSQNSSYVVLRQQGGAGGLSTFSLSSGRSGDQPPVTMRDVASWAMTLKGRPELHQALAESSPGDQRMLDRFWENVAGAGCIVPQGTVDSARATGTYLDLPEVCRMYKTYNHRLTETGAGDGRDQLRDSIPAVHIADSHGQSPYTLNPFQIDGGCVLYLLVNMLLHCRELHRRFCSQLSSPNADAILVADLQALCKAAENNNLKSFTRVRLRALAGRCFDLVGGDIANPGSPERCVANVIERLIPSVTVFRLEEGMEGRHAQELLETEGNVVLFDCVDAPFILDELSARNECVDVLWAATSAAERDGIQFDAQFDFRWDYTKNWFSVRHKSFRRVDTVRPLHWKLLLYVSRDEASCLARDEYINMSGGQVKLRCATHRERYLMKEHVGSGLLCSRAPCTKQVRWRCSYNFTEGPQCQCSTGVCLGHAKEFLNQEGISYVEDTRGIPTRSANAAAASAVPRGDETHQPLLEEQFGDVYERVDRDDLLACEDDLSDCLFFSANVPFQTPGETASFSSGLEGCAGHFLLKDHLRCFTRVGINRPPPVCFQRVLQHIHSTCPTDLPLLYPEGLLFPEIFYATMAGAVVGAVPSVLYSEAGRKTQIGRLATLQDHLATRLRNHLLLTSASQPYISFAFDTLLNQELQANSAYVAVRKGLEHLCRTFVSPDQKESRLKFDEVDARREVNRLAALVRQRRATYFLTLTCNDSETIGVWPIKQAVAAEHHPEDREFKEQWQSLCALVCRQWYRVVKYVFDYILHSDALGPVEDYWLRFEFQDTGALGNRPHVHALIFLDPARTDTDANLSRVANTVQGMFCTELGTKCKQLIASGVVANHAEFDKLYDLCENVLSHSCSAAGSRCKKRQHDGTLKCRVPRYPYSFFNSFVETPRLYSDATLELFKTLGLAHENELGKTVLDEKELVGGRWEYRTEPRSDGRISVPSSPNLFPILRSMINLQVVNDKHVSAYLVKYVGGIDAKRDASFKATKDTDIIDVELQSLHNEKISGASKNEKKLRDENQTPEPLAREISLTEMCWFNLRQDYVMTSVEFVHAQTKSLEYRMAVHKHNHGPNRKLVGEDGLLKGVVSRNRLLQPWRQFTASQQLMMHDASGGDYYVDTTTAFSLRPPELLAVDKLEQYCQWFCFSSCKEFTADADLRLSPWIDGRCKLVRIRHRYVRVVAQHFEALERDGVASAVALAPLLRDLCRELARADHSEEFKRFVDAGQTRRVVVVMSNVTPLNFPAFLVHLILSMGHFETEIDIFGSVDMREALRKAQLLPVGVPVVAALNRLARDYIMQQLRFLPVGSRRFQQLALSMYQNLRRLLLGNDGLPDAMPLATQRAIREAAEPKLVAVEKLMRDNLVSALLSCDLPGVTEELLSSSHGFVFEPTVTQLPGQSDDSFLEQNQCLSQLQRSVDEFCSPAAPFVRSIVVAGAPGVGKTFLLTVASVYVLSKGLRTTITSLTSERARVLGGEHLHHLLCLPVESSLLQTPNTVAHKCLGNLAKHPLKMAALRRLDVLFVEEIGLLSVSLVCAMDMILRRVRGSEVPFGGLLLIATGDPKQLPPVKEEAFWRSQLLMQSFKVMLLRCYVRSRDDEDLQRVITLMRQPLLNDEDVAFVVDALSRRCRPNSVSTWDEVPDGVLMVVGKRSAEREAVARFLERKRNSPEVHCSTFTAVDEVETTSGTWRNADTTVSKVLDRTVLEPAELVLFVGALMRVTYNNNHPRRDLPRFSQGQLVVVTELPDQCADSANNKVVGKLVPPGVRNVNGADNYNDWKVVKLARRASESVVVGRGSTKGRREQFPLRYFVVSTIHKVIGETCSRLATQIGSCLKYSLWQREQLLTLVSRVQSLHDIIFVGNMQVTLTAVQKLLREVNPLAERIDFLLDQHDILHDADRVMPLNACPLLPVDCDPLSSVDAGFVYLCVSAQDPLSFFQLGHTANLREAMHTLNSTLGSVNVASKRPWVLMAYVYGFRGHGADRLNVRDREYFLNMWQAVVNQPPPLNSEGVYQNGINTVQFYNELDRQTDPVVLRQVCVIQEPQRPTCRRTAPPVRPAAAPAPGTNLPTPTLPPTTKAHAPQSTASSSSTGVRNVGIVIRDKTITTSTSTKSVATASGSNVLIDRGKRPRDAAADIPGSNMVEKRIRDDTAPPLRRSDVLDPAGFNMQDIAKALAISRIHRKGAESHLPAFTDLQLESRRAVGDRPGTSSGPRSRPPVRRLSTSSDSD